MGTQILKGSTGQYQHPKIKHDSDSCKFTVTADTCLEAEKLPVIFDGATEGCGCWITMKQAKFDNTAKYQDY